VPELFGG
jgi:hypothetical protein